MSAEIQWEGVEEMLIKIEKYGDLVEEAVVAVAEYFQPVIENYAKTYAPWMDRTGNARQSLFTAVEVADDVVTLYLSHHVDYGMWLEFANAGKYAIIMPTLIDHYDAIMQKLRDIFNG